MHRADPARNRPRPEQARRQGHIRGARGFEWWARIEIAVASVTRDPLRSRLGTSSGRRVHPPPRARRGAADREWRRGKAEQLAARRPTGAELGRLRRCGVAGVPCRLPAARAAHATAATVRPNRCRGRSSADHQTPVRSASKRGAPPPDRAALVRPLASRNSAEEERRFCPFRPGGQRARPSRSPRAVIAICQTNGALRTMPASTSTPTSRMRR